MAQTPNAPPPTSSPPGPDRARLSPTLDRVLALGPIAIAVLWVAGTMRLHGFELQPMHWLVLTAAAFAMFVIGRRTSRAPLPALPENARAIPLAAQSAMIMAVLAAIVGGVLEAVSASWLETNVPWGLRMLWHAACTFGGSYCAFLRRLLRVLPA